MPYLKCGLILMTLMFSFPAFFRAIHGRDVSLMQNVLWEVPLAVFITLQWLI